jgi:hypothetical protein
LGRGKRGEEDAAVDSLLPAAEEGRTEQKG